MLFSCQVSLGNKKFFCGMFCCSKWLLSVKPPGFCSLARGRGFVVLLRKFLTILRDLFLKGSYCLSQRAIRSFFPPSKYFFLSLPSVLSKLLIFCSLANLLFASRIILLSHSLTAFLIFSGSLVIGQFDSRKALVGNHSDWVPLFPSFAKKCTFCFPATSCYLFSINRALLPLILAG